MCLTIAPASGQYQTHLRKEQKQKTQHLSEVITYDKWTILDDPDVNVVVELIDDPIEAYEIVKEAMTRGKHVVTANKKMLAHHMGEFIELQQKHNVSLLYEASSCRYPDYTHP